MTLHNYPVPELDVTLQEVSRVLQLTLGPDLYPKFKSTLEQQRELLLQVQHNFATRVAGKENWATEQFKRGLLSCTDPLPTSTAIPVVLVSSKAKRLLQHGGRSLDAVQKSVEALEDCFLFNASKGSVFNKDGKNDLEATIVDGSTLKSGSVACVQSVKNPIKAARCVMDKSSHSLIVGDEAEEFLQGLEEKEKPAGPQYFYTDKRHRELTAMFSGGNSPKNNHPQTVGAVALDHLQGLAAASSTGGLVRKLKGRVGDTAVVGAGIYADDKLAITCSGDGDVFLRHTVAQKIANLYHHKGFSLRQACREVMTENLNGICAGIIAVDTKGDAVIETNAGVMFVASVMSGISQVQVLSPPKSFSNVI
uniref:Isoaspartyl peptidase/L-asparaginase n=1 Tax=Monopterus albus TaxID=43700 RepID=A0A3Q3QE61_MONAL